MPETLSQHVVECSSPDEVCRVVAQAIADDAPVVDYGLAHEGLGNPPPPRHTPIKLTGGVQHHDPRAMTVRVDGGCPFSELGRVLAESGQFLPIDAYDDLTIGEMITHDVYGPLRLGYGAISDMLLGLTYVDGQARQIRIGGPNEDHLAGHDLRRLMVGSLGELGILTEATLRTFPMPAGTLSFDISLESPEMLDNLLPQWLTTNARPTWLMLGRQNHHFVLHGAYFGHTAECMSRLRSLETLIERQPGLHIVGTGEDRVDRDRLRRTTRAAWRRTSPAVVKIVVPPATTGFLCATLSETPAQAPNRLIEAFPAHGCVYVGGPFDPDDARRLDQQVTHVTQPVGGFHVWHRRPGGAEDIEPFSPTPEDYQTLTDLKAVMDPHGIFNPGRFLPTIDGFTNP